jgi:hypothetical protein
MPDAQETQKKDPRLVRLGDEMLPIYPYYVLVSTDD